MYFTLLYISSIISHRILAVHVRYCLFKDNIKLALFYHLFLAKLTYFLSDLRGIVLLDVPSFVVVVVVVVVLEDFRRRVFVSEDEVEEDGDVNALCGDSSATIFGSTLLDGAMVSAAFDDFSRVLREDTGVDAPFRGDDRDDLHEAVVSSIFEDFLCVVLSEETDVDDPFRGELRDDFLV